MLKVPGRCRSIIIGLVYLMILFENIITVYFPLMGYWDEAITLFSVGVIIFTVIKRTVRIDKHLFAATLAFIIFILAGLISNVLHSEYQPVESAKFKDLFAASKLFLIVMGMFLLFEKQDCERIINVCARVSKVSITVMLICAVLEYSVGIGMSKGFRIIPCFSFLFSHVTYAVAAYVIMLAVLVADNARKNFLFIVATMFLTILTMRSKGLAIVGVTVVLLLNKKYNFIQWIKKKDKKVVFSKIFIGILIVVGLFFLKDKIKDYLSWGMKAARTGLYAGGFIIANQFLPFGSGFGTFATFTSGKYYSSIYYELGLHTVSGMTPTKYTYIADVFWPSIYGQTGYLGLIAYVAMLVFFIKYYLKKVDIRSWSFYGCVIIWLYAIIASTAEAYFTNSSVGQFAVLFAAFLAMATAKNKEMMIENGKA